MASNHKEHRRQLQNSQAAEEFQPQEAQNIAVGKSEEMKEKPGGEEFTNSSNISF